MKPPGQKPHGPRFVYRIVDQAPAKSWADNDGATHHPIARESCASSKPLSACTPSKLAPKNPWGKAEDANQRRARARICGLSRVSGIALLGLGPTRPLLEIICLDSLRWHHFWVLCQVWMSINLRHFEFNKVFCKYKIKKSLQIKILYWGAKRERRFRVAEASFRIQFIRHYFVTVDLVLLDKV